MTTQQRRTHISVDLSSKKRVACLRRSFRGTLREIRRVARHKGFVVVFDAFDERR